jgi:hypothetical protein
MSEFQAGFKNLLVYPTPRDRINLRLVTFSQAAKPLSLYIWVDQKFGSFLNLLEKILFFSTIPWVRRPPRI